MSRLRPPEGWLSLPLLAVAILSPVASVVAANWVDHLGTLYWAALGGLLVGFLFARLGRPELLLHVLATLGGTLAVAYYVAATLPRAPEGLARLVVLWRHLLSWLAVVGRGGFASDPTLFLLLLAAVTWLSGYLGAWFVYRVGAAWWPLLVGGATLVVNLSYAPELAGYVVPFAVASLLLLARLNLLRQEEAWQEAGLRYSAGVWTGTLPAALAGALVAASVGWLAPEVPPRQDVYDAIYQASQPLREAQRSVETEFNRAFGGLRSRGPSLPSTSGFSSSIVLGGQFRLADTPVLRVSAPEAHYWRAITYDTYTGRGWSVGSGLRSLRAEAGAPLPGSRYEQRQEVTQVVEVLRPRGDYLVGASAPLRVDLPASVEALAPPAGARAAAGPGATPEVVALHAALTPGRRYTVVSAVSRASAATLRRNEPGSQSYPREIDARYRSLPEVPRRVRELAAQLTRGQDNPYDRARAVESYLRTLTYSLEVAPPPPDRDAVEFFLFETRTGYCDYFASAMAVLLRSAGVPARVASGYTAGSREGPEGAFEGTFLVRDNNAHSWVEAYFPRYGWIVFDPSPNQPRVEHPEAAFAAPTPRPTPGATPGAADATPTPPAGEPSAGPPTGPSGGAAAPALWLRTLAVAATALALVVGLPAVAWWAGVAGLPPAVAAYARLAQLAGLLGWRRRPAETPREYAGRLARLAPGRGQPFRIIADAFTAHRFGHRAPSRDEATILARAWQGVRGSLLGAAARRWLGQREQDARE